MVRQKAREEVFLLIFERLSLSERNEFSLENVLAIAGTQTQYVKAVYDIVDLKLEFFNRHLNKFALKFKLERFYKVDLSLLVLATVEIMFVDDVPDLVAVNEALELAKKYSSEKSNKFINGILGAVIDSKEKLLHLFNNPDEDVDEVVAEETSEGEEVVAVETASELKVKEKDKNNIKNEVRIWRAK